jgi:hypothetical protein
MNHLEKTMTTINNPTLFRDTRNNKTPVFSRRDHQHWIFSVSFNKFHDQLVLTSGSDGKVLLTCAASCSSESTVSSIAKDISNDDGDSDGDEFQMKAKRSQLKDGLLEKFEQHEDSGESSKICVG